MLYLRLHKLNINKGSFSVFKYTFIKRDVTEIYIHGFNDTYCRYVYVYATAIYFRVYYNNYTEGC